MSPERLVRRLEELWGSPPLSTVAALAGERGVGVALVGGAVRDLALCLDALDLDLVVESDAESFARECADRLGGSLVPLDTERGILRVALADGYHLDFALQAGETLEDDLRRRDFTVNAVASVPDRGVVDPLGGLADLQRRELRPCSDEALREDPLRVLRAVRLRARYGLTVDPAPLALHRELLKQVSPERIRDEWFAILAAGVTPQLELLCQTGLLFVLFPELWECRGVGQNYFHHLDVLEHTLEVVRGLEQLLTTEYGGFAPYARELNGHFAQPLAGGRSRGLGLKLVAFLHDISKPATRTVGEGGRIHFHGHELLGAGVAEGIARRLKLSNKEVRYVHHMVALHLTPVLLPSRNPSRRELHRFLHKAGDDLPDLIVLSRADVLATRGPAQNEERLEAHRELGLELLEEYFSQGRLANPRVPVSGKDLTEALGLAPGPTVGWLLERLREAAALGQVETREEALKLASRWLFENQPASSR